MPGHPLQLSGHVNQFVDGGIRIILLLEILRCCERLIQRHVQFIGHKFRYRVYLCIRNRHRPAYIPDSASGRHGAEGDDLRHMVGTIFCYYIVNDLLAFFITEINIKIRHRYPLRIQKALKEQMVADRVYAGNADAVSA